MNPFELIYYRAGWSQKKTERNNAMFWAWEIIYNGFVPANAGPNFKENFIAANPALPALLKSNANR